MVYHRAPQINSGQRTEPEQAVVGSTEALVVETVKLLARGCPQEILAEAAYEDVLALKPHLEEALEILEGVKGCRSLTEKERSQEYAFRMLLACRW